jgi:lipid-A-disaccharide synthase
MLKKMPNGPSRFRVATGMTRQALRLARAALVCSGTATVEAALLGCPMAVVYRMGAVSYLLARRLVRVNHIGMVNIIAGERLCPEFVQNAAEPDALAAAVQPWLRDGPEREAMLRGLQRVADALGPPGASERAAAIILRNLER